MRRAAALLAGVCWVGCATVPSAPAADPRALLERGLAAQGGRAALDAVRTLRQVARVEHHGESFVVVASLRRPLGIRQEVQGGRYEGVSVLSGDRGWFRQGHLRGPLAPDQVAQLVELRKNWVPLLGAEGETLTAGGREDRGGRAHDVLVATDTLGRVRRLLLDAESGALAYTIATGRGHEVAIAYGDYRPVGPLRWPHCVEVSTDGVLVKRMVTHVLELDPPLDDADFREP